MARYKLIQDIEAEDHILGPLTLRQFIYALVAILFYYLCFLAIDKHALVVLLIFLPPGLLATFLAFPFKRDQPTEVWAIAKLQYLMKPRVRIWSQSGVKDLVTITAPKRVERQLTNGLSEDEARNRLEALALTVDSRGRAALNGSLLSGSFTTTTVTDRLIEPQQMPRPVPDYDVSPADDILEDDNPISLDVAGKLQQATIQHRANIINTLSKPNQVSSDTKEWLTNQSGRPDSLTTIQPTQISPTPKSTSIPVINKANKPDVAAPKNPSAKPVNPAILNLAGTNNLSISSLAHEANEVVVKLH